MELVDPHEIAIRLSRADLKVTPQRLTIYGELLERDDHPSPESLYHSVRDDLPKLSLATVYKTLDALEGAGLISQVSLPNDAKRYDVNLEPHHHLVCNFSCRKITDFNDKKISVLGTTAHGVGLSCATDPGSSLGTLRALSKALQTRKSDGEGTMPSTFYNTTEEKMASLEGSKTHDNLKAAFAGESQANRRYLYFAKVADVEGYPEIASNFRETAEGETGYAHGHLDYIKKVGDPATGLPIGDSIENLKALRLEKLTNIRICTRNGENRS